MSINVQPRNTGTPTLAAAVQGGRPAPAKDVTGQASRHADTVETSPAAAAATPTQEKKDDFLSPKFAALARQEKQIRAERAKIKAERDALEAEKSARLNGYIPKDKFKDDPLSALEEAGLSYDDLAKRLLEAPQSQVDPTVRAMQAKISDLESKLSQFTKSAEESKSTAYQQALDTIRHKVNGVVNSSSEFEMIKSLEQTDAVVALIEETFKAEGYVMSEEEAAREVEEHLLSEAVRMSALEKVKKKLAPAPAAETPKEEAAAPKQEQQQQQITTLSNALQSNGGKRLSESERRQRAILAAQGKLTN